MKKTNKQEKVPHIRIDLLPKTSFQSHLLWAAAMRGRSQGYAGKFSAFFSFAVFERLRTSFVLG